MLMILASSFLVGVCLLFGRYSRCSHLSSLWVVLQYPKNIVVWFLVLVLGVLRILLISGLLCCLALILLMDLCLIIVFLGPFDQ